MREVAEADTPFEQLSEEDKEFFIYFAPELLEESASNQGEDEEDIGYALGHDSESESDEHCETAQQVAVSFTMCGDSSVVFSILYIFYKVVTSALVMALRYGLSWWHFT